MTRALVGLALAAPAVAAACPVCFDTADGKVLRWYSFSTMMLSLLPFAILAGLALAAYHLRRQTSLPPADAPDVTP